LIRSYALPPHPPEGYPDFFDVMAVAFSPDGTRVAAALRDTTVRIIELTSGLTLELRGHTSGLRAVAFSPDGSLVASAGHDDTIHIWESETGHEKAVLQVPGQGGVECLSFSHDGHYLAAAGRDGVAGIWEIAQGKQITAVRMAPNGLVYVAFSRDDETLLFVSWTGTIITSDIYGEEIRRSDSGTDSSWWTATVSPDERVVLGGGGDGSLAVLDSQTGQVLQVVRSSDQQVRGIAFSPSQRMFATSGTDGIVRLFDSTTYNLISELPLRDSQTK
jgi:WD40 repeat protein